MFAVFVVFFFYENRYLYHILWGILWSQLISWFTWTICKNFQQCIIWMSMLSHIILTMCLLEWCRAICFHDTTQVEFLYTYIMIRCMAFLTVEWISEPMVPESDQWDLPNTDPHVSTMTETDTSFPIYNTLAGHWCMYNCCGIMWPHSLSNGVHCLMLCDQ